jgi:hypothetical protein
MDWILSYIILSSLSLIALIIGILYVTHDEFIERRERERMYRRIERRRYLCIKLIIKKRTFNYVNEKIFIIRYNKFTLPFSYPKHFFYL